MRNRFRDFVHQKYRYGKIRFQALSDPKGNTKALIDAFSKGARNAVTNEIDVVAVRGIQPLFISCKTNEIRTEALNELAVIRDRFGGKGTRAMIVTSANATRSRAVMRMRAAELGIEAVELGDLVSDRLVERLNL